MKDRGEHRPSRQEREAELFPDGRLGVHRIKPRVISTNEEKGNKKGCATKLLKAYLAYKVGRAALEKMRDILSKEELEDDQI